MDEKNEALSALVMQQITNWPDEIKIFAPGANEGIEAWATFLEKGQALYDRYLLATNGPPPGNSPGPRPSGLADAQAGVKALRERYRKSGLYSF